jgi:hypothetical protein
VYCEGVGDPWCLMIRMNSRIFCGVREALRGARVYEALEVLGVFSVFGKSRGCPSQESRQRVRSDSRRDALQAFEVLVT